jgi:hypothetical protein
MVKDWVQWWAIMNMVGAIRFLTGKELVDQMNNYRLLNIWVIE